MKILKNYGRWEKKSCKKKKTIGLLQYYTFEPICKYWALEEINHAIEKDKVKKKGFLIK